MHTLGDFHFIPSFPSQSSETGPCAVVCQPLLWKEMQLLRNRPIGGDWWTKAAGRTAEARESDSYRTERFRGPPPTHPNLVTYKIHQQ